MTTTTTTSNKPLSGNQAQRIMLSVMEKARKQIDVAASRTAPARVRAQALKRLQRALAALEEPKK